MSSLVKGFFRGAEKAGVRSALHGVESSAMHSGIGALTSGARGGLSQVDHAIAKKAFKEGAGDAPRVLESATNDALGAEMKAVGHAPITNINTKYDWKAITAIGAVGTGGGLLLNHEVRRDVKDVGDAAAAVAEKAGDAAAAVAEKAEQAIIDAAAKAREEAAVAANLASDVKTHAADAAKDLAQHLPSSTTIASGLTGVASSATMLLVAGLGVFVAYEAYRFSRGSN